MVRRAQENQPAKCLHLLCNTNYQRQRFEGCPIVVGPTVPAQQKSRVFCAITLLAKSTNQNPRKHDVIAEKRRYSRNTRTHEHTRVHLPFYLATPTSGTAYIVLAQVRMNTLRLDCCKAMMVYSGVYFLGLCSALLCASLELTQGNLKAYMYTAGCLVCACWVNFASAAFQVFHL